MTATTFDRSYFVQHGTEDDTAKARQEKEAERDHRERLAAVRVVAGLAAGAGEAREIYEMLGLSDDEVREARGRVVTAVPSAVTAVSGVVAGVSGPVSGVVSGPRRRGKVTAA